MADFLYRLWGSTDHFPLTLTKRREIKDRLNKETVHRKYSVNGKETSLRRLKNFGFTDIVSIYEEFGLIGNNNIIYKYLRGLSRIRNRVHILNYFNNFEKDESRVFSKNRARAALYTMTKIIEYHSKKYPRPWTVNSQSEYDSFTPCFRCSGAVVEIGGLCPSCGEINLP